MCGTTRKTGRFIVKRKTIRKRPSAKLNELKEELRRRWHQPVVDVGKWLKSVVQGYFNYHAVPGNMDSLNSFRAQVIWRWYRALRRRSQRTRMTWERFWPFPDQNSGNRSLARAAAILLLVAYLLYFSWDRIRTHFAADDMMNLGIYFRQGFWRTLASQVLLWKGFYRPMAAAFYLPLYHWFGLNPVPFHIAILALLAVNAILVFFLARELGCEDLPSFLAAMAVSYHAGLPNLQYSIAMVYDVLCFTFFVGTVLFYVRIRRQKRLLRPGELVIFLALFICALNSKEMALTLPLVLVAYEWFYHRLSSNGARLVIFFAIALTVTDLLGKRAGSNPMLSYEAYQPVLTLQRFMAFQKASLHDLFGLGELPGWRTVAGIWLLLTYVAWRRDRPVLRFCWAWMLITPVPIEFLVDRVQGCLYIPLVGWAIFGAVTFADVAKTASNFLVHEPIFSRLGRTGALALLVGLAVFLWARHMRDLKLALVQPAAAREGVLTWSVIEQLRALNPRAAPNSQVIFLNDPFTDWDMTFIGQLWFGERSVHVYTQRMEHQSPAEISRMDEIFDFQNGKLVRVK